MLMAASRASWATIPVAITKANAPGRRSATIGFRHRGGLLKLGGLSSERVIGGAIACAFHADGARPPLCAAHAWGDMASRALRRRIVEASQRRCAARQ